MEAKPSEIEVAIRAALFEHETFESSARGNAAYPMESFLRLESTWPFTPEQIQQAIQKMVDEELIEVRDSHWYTSTAVGRIARETAWQKQGKRHQALTDDTADLQDIILALIRSGGYEYEHSEHPSLTDNELDVYLYEFDSAAKCAALQALVENGLIRRGTHIMDSTLPMSSMTAAGLRSYAQKVVPRLGLKPPETILAPVEREILPFDELGLPPVQADNLRYRWQEAERCIEARAWMGANIMFGSILEVVLPERLARTKQKAMSAKAAPTDRKNNKTLPLDRWRLADCINVAAELGLIDPTLTRHANALRETRNLVHPEVQISERSSPDGDITAISKQVVLAVLAALARSTS